MIARELVGIPSYAGEVEQGLTRNPKSLPSKLFYDARGSELFEQITTLPEYYPTRVELSILQQRASEIVTAAGVPVTVVELGSGTAEKTRTLLQELEKKQMLVPYFPADISRAALEEARERVETQCGKTRVRPVVADFSHGFGFLRDIPGHKLVLYLGSSIGNYDRDDAVEMLDGVRGELNEGDNLLIGTDMVKAPAILLKAYDDEQGVTAEFNKNILRRINRELSGNFNVDSFRHVALWNSRQSRMEMHLESMGQQTVEIELLGLGIKLAAGERIHTENSYKYTMPTVCNVLTAAGFTLEKTWKDSRDWFALHLASR